MRGKTFRTMGLLLIAGLFALAGCGGGGGGGNSDTNTAPVAVAESAGNIVLVGSVVELDGSGSSDADNNALTYSWAFTSRPAGSAAALSSATAARPTFSPDVEGDYVLRLIVNDGEADSAPDTVTIHAVATDENAAPVADAGSSYRVLVSTLVTLDGSNSSDANDGDTLTYAWVFTSRPSGSSAALTGATTAGPTFTPDVAGDYVLRLIVNDGTVNSAADTVTITAVSDFGGLFLKGRWIRGVAIDGVFQGNTTFTAIIKNVSNQTYSLTEYEFLNGGSVLIGTTNPADLGGDNEIAPNETVYVDVSTDPEETLEDLGLTGRFHIGGNTIDVTITTAE